MTRPKAPEVPALGQLCKKQFEYIKYCLYWFLLLLHFAYLLVTSKHDIDGKITFSEPFVNLYLGFSNNETHIFVHV